MCPISEVASQQLLWAEPPAMKVQTRWVWTDEGAQVVFFKVPFSHIKAGAEVEVAPESVRRQDLPLLILLGFYLILLRAEDAASASVASRVAATLA